jgi:hypothetical protein
MASTSSAPLFSLIDPILQHPFYAVIFVLLAYFTTSRLNAYNRLRHIPGPPTTGLSWLWHSRAIISGKAHIYYGDANEKYGPLARIAPDHLITSSPELWAHMSAVRSPYRRAEWFYHAIRFEPGKDSIFTDCENRRHDERRKKMASGVGLPISFSFTPTPVLRSVISTTSSFISVVS